VLPLTRSRPMLFVLATMLGLMWLGARNRVETGVRSTRATLMVVGDAIDAYRADNNGRCPESLTALGDEGYLLIEAKDAWGQPLQLTCPGRRHPGRYDLISFGPAGRELERIE
ncbi:MAG: type II secretion system protein GspG, partial [Myxococcota bacterium]